MSRRKQSNPKPFKKLSDDEDEDTDVKSTDSVRHDDLPPSTSPTDEDTGTHSNVVIKQEPTSPLEHVIPEREESEDQKPSMVYLNDVLLLRKVDEDEAQQTGRPFLVCAAIPLPVASSIGPFDADLVSLSSIRQGDLVLQAQDASGETNFVRVEDPNATWLTMLRPAPSESVRNTSVFYKDGQIWCEIIKELSFGAELLSSFTIQESEKSENGSPDLKDSKEGEHDMDVKAEIKSPPAVQSPSPVANGNAVNHAALLYGCPFCGVRFSSARTLEGHLTYYCSKKPSNADRENDRKSQKDTNTSEIEKRLKRSESTEKEECEKSNPDSIEDESETESTETKVLQTGETYHCPYCSYTSDKPSSLNRHKRIHARGSNSPTSSSSSSSPVSKQESYCADCNIQFSSFSTFKCHKEYYCSKRLDQVGMTSPINDLPSPTARNFPMAFSDQLSPGAAKNLKQLMTASSSSLISGQANVILGPPIVARGMLNIPFGMPTVIVQPVVPSVPHISPKKTPSLSLKDKTKTENTTDQPLDLSVTKKNRSSDDSDKENSPRSSVTPEMSKDDRSSVSSVASHSPSCRDRSSSAQSTDKTPSPNPTNRISPFISVPTLQYIGGKPVPPIPHTVSKCVDCNIVFYKHENYVIHKKHYCSSRQNKHENDSVDVESRESPTALENATVPKRILPLENGSKTDHSDVDSTKSEYTASNKLSDTKTVDKEQVTPENKSHEASSSDEPEEYHCSPCKIRFSSTSTLSAHKSFYCPFLDNNKSHSSEESTDVETKQTNGEAIAKCNRCNATFPSIKVLKLHYCTGVATHVPLLRCPYCDYVTQTENRISEHLKVHMPSKAYRCTICGYRGNTVRGMRMHGKMHIDNGEDFSDEHMVEIEEPPLVPIIFNSPTDPSSTNIEAELIRMKNEPYKRRRSRKSYEKSEHMINIRETIPKSICVYCGQPFSDKTSLAMHMRIHELVAYHAASSRNLKCHFCNQGFETFPNLLVHIEQKHLKDLTSIGEKSQTSEQIQGTSKSIKRPQSGGDNGTTSPKRSRTMSESSSLDGTSKCSEINDKVRNSLSKEDEERNRTLSLLNLSPKIKKEPQEVDEDSSDTKMNLNNNVNCKKRKYMSEESPERNSNEQTESNAKKKQPIDEKTNNKIALKTPPPPLHSPVLSPEIARYCQLAMQALPPLVVPRIPSRSLLSPSEQTEKTSANYCKYCDISFTYLSTYVAHKKYYCTARQPEEMASPTKA